MARGVSRQYDSRPIADQSVGGGGGDDRQHRDAIGLMPAIQNDANKQRNSNE
jgi:hypothetical protein